MVTETPQPQPLSAAEIAHIRWSEGKVFGLWPMLARKALATLDARDAEILQLKGDAQIKAAEFDYAGAWIRRQEARIAELEAAVANAGASSVLEGPATLPAVEATPARITLTPELVVKAAKWAGETDWWGEHYMGWFREGSVRSGLGVEDVRRQFATLCARYLVYLAKEQGCKWFYDGVTQVGTFSAHDKTGSTFEDYWSIDNQALVAVVEKLLASCGSVSGVEVPA